MQPEPRGRLPPEQQVLPEPSPQEPEQLRRRSVRHCCSVVPPEPERRCRPFDRDRTGRVVAEGACTFILEDRAHAEARGAKAYARLLGFGSSCVVDRQGNPQARQALVNAIRAALRDAGLKPEQIGHINAHGIGTRQTDIDEARAIHEVFGETAARVPVTAFKSYFGNSGAGSGTLEVAASIAGLMQGVILPTLNYEHPDPECRLNVVAGQPQPTDNRVFLKVNVTRMGQASASVVEAL
jgi:3-oxoacyl-[acyl-carrier-protein] synthase II